MPASNWRLIMGRQPFILVKRFASHSSHSWLERQKKDIFVKKSRYQNYRSRASFKLLEIDDRYNLLSPGKIVIDVGAAPGSWTQVICERLKLSNRVESFNQSSSNQGLCLALDLRKIEPVDGAICLSNVDFTSPFTQSKILEWLDDRRVDCILSDMAPDVSGQKSLDHERSMKLNYKLCQFASQVLRKDTGAMVAKVFEGNERQEWTNQLKKLFEQVRTMKPEASRVDSRETYVICRNFRGLDT